ncbi:MAG: cytochrome c1 [Gammaproteobacteria bacterium]|jgi:ubiquinol-cytochrome c reductase cytochrome c1 subunit
MKKVLIALIMMVPGLLHAAGGGDIHLESANINLGNDAAKQRGAKYFVNYCLNCHSLKYERWQRMQEFGLSIEDISEKLMPANAKPGDLMTIAMKSDDAKAWFGNPAPDLTLETRLRGEDWVYTYLKSFYLDDSRPFGVNNRVFDKVGMPHVLWELQGFKKAHYRYDVTKKGHVEQSFDSEEAAEAYVAEHGGDAELKISKVVDALETAVPGKLDEAEYDKVVRDIVTFMAYMAEPVKMERQRLGIWVLLFLAVLFVFAYLLKKEYWKDIH